MSGIDVFFTCKNPDCKNHNQPYAQPVTREQLYAMTQPGSVAPISCKSCHTFIVISDAEREGFQRLLGTTAA